jgi:hypothetical protein
MIPVIASTAASLVGKIYDDIAKKADDLSAQSAPQSADGVNFSTVLNHVGASNPTRPSSSAQALQHAAEFASQLSKSAEETAAVNTPGA